MRFLRGLLTGKGARVPPAGAKGSGCPGLLEEQSGRICPPGIDWAIKPGELGLSQVAAARIKGALPHGWRAALFMKCRK